MLFKLYLSKLNNTIESLWQKPRQCRVNYVDEDWYQSQPVGKDMLDRFMKLSLSQNVKLDGNYTNHSIRSTVITTLDTEGFEARHICALSSHKNEATIKEYSTKCPPQKRKQMFESLSKAILPPKQPKPSHTVTETNTELTIENVQQNLPQFDLQPLEDYDTIDDETLANLIYDNPLENALSDMTNKNVVAVPDGKSPQIPTQINNQVITNNNLPHQPFGRMPTMYFPNSSVTINYNFGK